MNESTSAPQQPEQKQPISIPMAILLAGFCIMVGLLFSRRGLPQAPSISPTPSELTASLDARQVNTTDEPIIGKADAPLVMAYWSDYQCPFCKQFETTVLPSLIKTYVDTGKMKIIFKDFAFLGSDSTDAGLMSEAVWHLYPDQFLAWNEAMFASQDGENTGFGNMASIVTMMKSQFPKMDATKLAQDIATNKTAYAQHLVNDETEAQKYGITGTPGFIVGTQQIAGAEPLDYFIQVIDAEYQKAIQGK